ncbi:adenylate/guanylate cyclase domain-containing protein [Nitriliruptor alkaliphilus]|uniref:adenylate/guanylate cyclase domain-containing protein n=1 Tax=Nitriliruptor alkaliphilus TaxID=427918 RepID=UPI000697D1DE|nr:adenylate/guanylate cyclase domain-containing protein [Nitriliruptor alkaliphilus]
MAPDRPFEVRLPVAPDRAELLLGAVRDRLTDPRHLPLRDVAFDVRVLREDLARLFAAAGRLRDDDRYGEGDRQYARDLATLLDRFDLPVLERMLRLHQRAMTTVVVNHLAQLQSDPRLAPMFDPDTEVPPEVIDAIAADAVFLLPVTQRLLALDHHEALLRLLNTSVVADASTSSADAIDLAVAFIDLVGFTRLSATAEPGIVAGVLGGFEDGVHEAASDVGEVLVVKFIGDAAMLVSGDVDRLVEVCLRVVEDPLPSGDEVERRAGIAAGGVQIRDGDYVGHPVNTAARLTDLARPGSVLVAEDATDRLAAAWVTRRLHARKLKGLGRLRPSRVWRPEGT